MAVAQPNKQVTSRGGSGRSFHAITSRRRTGTPMGSAARIYSSRRNRRPLPNAVALWQTTRMSQSKARASTGDQSSRTNSSACAQAPAAASSVPSSRATTRSMSGLGTAYTRGPPLGAWCRSRRAGGVLITPAPRAAPRTAHSRLTFRSSRSAPSSAGQRFASRSASATATASWVSATTKSECTDCPRG